MCSLSHPNATYKFVGEKIKHFGLYEKTNKHKTLPQTPKICCFHLWNTAAPFRMKIFKDACDTNTNVYKKKIF